MNCLFVQLGASRSLLWTKTRSINECGKPAESLNDNRFLNLICRVRVYRFLGIIGGYGAVATRLNSDELQGLHDARCRALKSEIDQEIPRSNSLCLSIYKPAWSYSVSCSSPSIRDPTFSVSDIRLSAAERPIHQIYNPFPISAPPPAVAPLDGARGPLVKPAIDRSLKYPGRRTSGH